MRLAVMVLGLLLIVSTTLGVAAQDGTAAPGLLNAVARDFRAASDGSTELFYLRVRVASFRTAEDASGAIPLWFEQQRTGDVFHYDVSEVSPIAITRLADETQALIGTVPFDEDPSITADVAFIAVREGRTLYLFDGWSSYGGVEDRVIDIAERTLGIEPLEFDPVPNVAYTSGAFWDALPRIEHLPAGMTWDGDFSPCVGVLGATDCPDDATPVATPEQNA